MRSDSDVTEKWKISFDVRVNYGILETRSDQYLTRLNASQTLYDIPGNRRETFGYLTIGISRYIEIEKKEKERQQRAKGSSHMYTPKKYPWPGPKKSKPKG